MLVHHYYYKNARICRKYEFMFILKKGFVMKTKYIELFLELVSANYISGGKLEEYL